MLGFEIRRPEMARAVEHIDSAISELAKARQAIEEKKEGEQ